jgi:cold shock CspA family protein
VRGEASGRATRYSRKIGDKKVEKLTGKVVTYNAVRGFGWIRVGNLLHCEFFHATQWRSDFLPVTGQEVEFSLDGDGKGRMQCMNVTPVEAAVVAETSNVGVR